MVEMVNKLRGWSDPPELGSAGRGKEEELQGRCSSRVSSKNESTRMAPLFGKGRKPLEKCKYIQPSQLKCVPVEGTGRIMVLL